MNRPKQDSLFLVRNLSSVVKTIKTNRIFETDSLFTLKIQINITMITQVQMLLFRRSIKEQEETIKKTTDFEILYDINFELMINKSCKRMDQIAVKM